MDWNIGHSSLFTGAGTPWGEGPQDPYKAQYKAFNPAEYQGMDTSALGKSLRQGIGQNTARSTSRLQGALQRSGGGGADAISGMAQLQAQQGQDENALDANLAMQDYQQRYNQWRDMMGLESQKANTDAARYAGEVGGRNQFASGLGSIIGTGLGSIGGPLGAAAGGSLAQKMFGKKDSSGNYGG